jgi:predicted dehydrogenase
MTISLGFVGLSAGYSWAGMSHLPGLRLINDSPYKITGVVNTSIESAKNNVEKNKLEDAQIHSSIDSMVENKNVDVVVVSVKLPDHYKFVNKAIEAGKDIICEWPSGNGLAEAEELVQFANSKGVKAGCVLQARKSPTLIKAKELIESGAIGRIVSTNFKGHHQNWGQYFPQDRLDYVLFKKNGASMLTILTGHDLDAIAFVLGEFQWLTGYLSSQFPDVNVVKSSSYLASATADTKMELTDEVIHRDIDDQVLVQGKLLSGSTASIHIPGEQTSELTRAEGLRWEIHGSKGGIVLTSDSCYAELSMLKIQMSQLDDNSNSTGIVDLIVPYHPLRLLLVVPSVVLLFQLL